MPSTQARFFTGPVTYQVAEQVYGGRLVEARTGGLIGLAADGSAVVLGVAAKNAAPTGTYPVDGNPLNVALVVDNDDRVAVFGGPNQVKVDYAGAAAFGDRLVAAADGKVRPYVAGSGAATNEVQTVTIGGTPTAGTFTLTLGDATTADLAFDVAAADMQSALEALDTVGTGNVTVALATGVYTVTFSGDLAGEPIPQMVADDSNLTGGTVTVATSTEGGGAGTAINTIIGWCAEPNGVAEGEAGQVHLSI